MKINSYLLPTLLFSVTLSNCGGDGKSHQQTLKLNEGNLKHTTFLVISSLKYQMIINQFLTKSPPRFSVSEYPDWSDTECISGSLTSPDLPMYIKAPENVQSNTDDLVYSLPKSGTANGYWDSCQTTNGSGIQGQVRYDWDQDNSAVEVFRFGENYHVSPQINQFTSLDLDINVHVDNTHYRGKISVENSDSISYSGSFGGNELHIFKSRKYFDESVPSILTEMTKASSYFYPEGRFDIWGQKHTLVTSTIEQINSDSIKYRFKSAYSSSLYSFYFNNCPLPEYFQVINSDDQVEAEIFIKSCDTVKVRFDSKIYNYSWSYDDL